MKELDQLVENFFQPKPKGLGLDQLVEMVEEVMKEQTLEEAIGDIATEKLYQDVATAAGEVNVNKLDQARKLARISYDQYRERLASLYQLFPEGPIIQLSKDNYPDFWKGYTDSKRKGDEKWEDALVKHANANNVNAKAANDAIIDGLGVEVKASSTSTPQFKLNSSAIKRDQAYMLITDSGSETPKALIISGDLLWKIATYPLQSAAIAAGMNLQEYIESELNKAFADINLAGMAADTVMTGNPSPVQKNFQLGDSALTAQVRIMFTLGKIPTQEETP
tara:strand:- start:335 stop:1171 length:837 start_codon:yes stop_codon:yes gene_type:complete